MTDPETTILSHPDYTAIKIRQRSTWSSGDYSKIGTTLQIVGEDLAEALAMPAHARVLDVAAGNGNVSLAMARRWCTVVSTDYVEELLACGRLRAAAEDLDIEFRTADAEDLPFGAAEFEAVVSTFGVMFAPDQQRAVSELVRVCRPGGKIGLANWTPESFIGCLFKVIGKYAPPPRGVDSPATWGSKDWIRESFGAHATDIAIALRTFTFSYASPQHFIEVFREFYGPVEKAFLSLDEPGQAALQADLLALIDEFNTATDGTMRVPGEYAEIVITKAH